MATKKPSRSREREAFLSTEGFRRNLKQKAIHGVVVTGASQACNIFIRVGSTMLLARLLRPEEFGLIAMASAAIAIIALAGDLGLSEATIQREDVTHAQLSSLFWVNVAVGLILAGLNAAFAPVLVLLYGDDRILLVSVVLGAEFVFRGLGYQHQAVLNRTMRFKSIAVVNAVAIAGGTLLTLLAALWGLEYWSLVIWQLAPALIFVVGMWITCEWRPGLPAFPRGVVSLLWFGGNLTLFNVCNAMSQNLDKVLLGTRWGPYMVGVYSKASQLLFLAYQVVFFPLARVVVPTLSRLSNETSRYERYYCKTATLIGYATMPMLVIVGVLAEEVVRLALGSQWSESVPIVKVLCVAAFGKAFVDSTNWVAISSGKTGRMLKWGLVSTPLMIAGFAIGARWGGLGVAASYAVCIHVLNVPKFCVFLHQTPVSKVAALRAIECPASLSLLMCPILYFVRELIQERSTLVAFLITGAAAVSFFAVGVIAWPKARREVFELMATLRLLRRRPDDSEVVPNGQASCV